MKKLFSSIVKNISNVNFNFSLKMERVKDSIKRKYRIAKVRLKKMPAIHKLYVNYSQLRYKVLHSKVVVNISNNITNISEKLLTPKVRRTLWTIKRSTGYKFLIRFAAIMLTFSVAISILNDGLDSEVSNASEYERLEDDPARVVTKGNDIKKPTSQGNAGQVLEPSRDPQQTAAPEEKEENISNGFVATEDNSAWLAKARRNTYDEKRFINKNGLVTYSDANHKKSYIGVDVSTYQGKINWAEVKASGVQYAMIRVGLRGYVTGKIVYDERFEYNIKEASKNGLAVGVYFFSQAINTKEAIQEANFVLKAIKKYKITMPVVFDGEHVPDATARTNIAQLNNKERTDICIAFCDTIRKAGYMPMIYDNKSHLEGGFQLSRLNNVYVWYARYADYPGYKYAYEMWQYTESGKIPGIKTAVDVSVCTVNFPSKVSYYKTRFRK